MDGNQWLLGLILAFEARVRLELESVKFDAERFMEAMDAGDEAKMNQERENALKGIAYIQRQCDTLARLRDLGPESVQPNVLVR